MRILLLALAALLGASCSLRTQPPAPRPAVYDFGPAGAAVPARLAVPVSLAGVTAPTWLAGSGIVYRLAYADAARLSTYAESAWAAPPAELLEPRLRAALAGAGGSGAPLSLRLELAEFSQVYDSPQASRGVVVALASLYPAGSRQPVASREFRAERPAPSADARGGVAALTGAAEALVADVLRWAEGEGR